MRGATLASEAETGSGLFDTAQPQGQKGSWRVVDVAVEGPALTLGFDGRLVGDPAS